MPRTIDAGFDDFLNKLTPSDAETAKAADHRTSIKACLENNYTLKRFFRTGSFGNGTSIFGHSDIDYLACVATGDLKENSTSSLSILRGNLDARFPFTGVAVDCPAVKVLFGTYASEAHEITIADYQFEMNGFKVYHIADCNGGWRYASPEAHNAYVRRVNERINGKLKPLIMFIKAWKFYQEVPISSFYLEMAVALYGSAEAAIVYSIDIKTFLKRLEASGLIGIVDPMGISGVISPCKTAAQLEQAKSKLSTAAARAEKARTAEHEGKIGDAFYWWDLLYNGQFPNYYY